MGLSIGLEYSGRCLEQKLKNLPENCIGYVVRGEIDGDSQEGLYVVRQVCEAGSVKLSIVICMASSVLKVLPLLACQDWTVVPLSAGELIRLSLRQNADKG